MWAAKIATMRGHEVTLYEKENGLGGQVAIAMKGGRQGRIRGHYQKRTEPATEAESAYHTESIGYRRFYFATESRCSDHCNRIEA